MKIVQRLWIFSLITLFFGHAAMAKILDLSVLDTKSSETQQLADNSGWVPDTNTTSEFRDSCTLEYDFIGDGGEGLILQLHIEASDSTGPAKIQNVAGVPNGLNVYGNLHRPKPGEQFHVSIRILDKSYNDVSESFFIHLQDIESYVQVPVSGSLGWIIDDTHFLYYYGLGGRKYANEIINGSIELTDGTFDMRPNDHAAETGSLLHWDGIKLEIISDGTKASDPVPAVHTVEVPLNQILSWTPGLEVLPDSGHDVYFGMDCKDVFAATSTDHPGVTYVNVTDPQFDPGLLDIHTTYYWRVDEIGAMDIAKGNLWQFTTVSGYAYDPGPADKADKVDTELSVLTWTPSSMAITQDVYFGMNFEDANDAATPVYSGLNGSVNQVSIPEAYRPLIDEGVTYYWRVDTHLGEYGTVKGEVWSFTSEIVVKYEEYKPYKVDSPYRLADNSGSVKDLPAFILGEWNAAGDMDGWSDTGLTGKSVANGILTATGTTDAPYIELTNIGHQPDLDLGYFDFIQFRLKLPAGFDDDIVFYFGTSVKDGIDTTGDRSFVLPAEYVQKDGEWHTYRIDVGLVVWWRDYLDDFRMLPLGHSGNGASFSLDYVEVGDIKGDILLVNDNLNIGNSGVGSVSQLSKMESKHAVIWWKSSDSGKLTLQKRRLSLRMIEESYQIFCNKLGYLPPFENTEEALRDGNRYKVNQVTYYTGFWMGSYEGFAYFNVNDSGLNDESYGNPVPHEFGHVVQGHQPGKLFGGHWESHTNFMRESRNSHFRAIMSPNYWPGINLRASCELQNVHQDHKRIIYQDYRVHRAIQHHAVDLGLPANMVSKFWTEEPTLWTVYDKLAQMLPSGYDVRDVLGYCMRHWPLLDMKEDSINLRNLHWSDEESMSRWFYVGGSHLIPCQDNPGWYRVPFARAPEMFATMHHELDPLGDTLTVEFAGYELITDVEDWRWSLAATDENCESIRYTELLKSGDITTLQLEPGESRVFVIVVATPDTTTLDLDGYQNVIAKDKHPLRMRYPYEVRLVNAVPTIKQYQRAKGAGAPHPNGGGWVDSTAHIEPTAYVGPNAMVLDEAVVLGNARVEDYAVMMDNARIEDNAVISGFSLLQNTAWVRNNAKFRDRAMASDNTQIYIVDDSVVEEYAILGQNYRMFDNTITRGIASPWACAATGTAIADYDFSMNFNISDGVHFDHVPWGNWYELFFTRTQVKPNGLIASYRFEEPAGQVVWDEFGAKHGVARGDVERIFDQQMQSNALRLNGIDHYVVVDRGLCDFVRGSFGLSIKPVDNTDAPLLYMGSSPASYLELALDGTAHARFTITDGVTTVVVTSPGVVPAGSWTNICVTLDGNFITMYINGVEVAQQAATIRPDAVLGSNDYTQPEAFYVGRDWGGDLFAGDVDDVRFYNLALNADEVKNEYVRSGDILGAYFVGEEMDFNGYNTRVQSGVKDGVARVLEAMIYPESSSFVGYYEAIFDSTCEAVNSGNNQGQGSGLGLNDDKFVVRLPGADFWHTGIDVELNQWQHVKLSYDGSNAEFYLDGELVASKSYSANEWILPNKNFRIGFAMDQTGKEYYFDGKIKDAYIRGAACDFDTTPPTPGPAEWLNVPAALNTHSIAMKAKTGDDDNAYNPEFNVLYRFDEVSGNPGGTDSGWQTEAVYVDEGLQPMTEYRYVVRMKDVYGNVTEDSELKVAVTGPEADTVKDGVVNLLDLAKVAMHWLETDCAANNWCDGADLDMSGDVGMGDLVKLYIVWLSRDETPSE